MNQFGGSIRDRAGIFRCDRNRNHSYGRSKRMDDLRAYHRGDGCRVETHICQYDTYATVIRVCTNVLSYGFSFLWRAAEDIIYNNIHIYL